MSTSASTSVPPFTQLPAEVVLHIASELGGADDLASLSSTCRPLHRLIQGNKLLYRQLYLNNYDDPADDPTYKVRPRWEPTTKNIARVRRILRKDVGDEVESGESIPLIARTVSTLLRTTNGKNKHNNRELLKSFFPTDTEALRNLMCRSSLYRRQHGRSLRPTDRSGAKIARASAKLHCLYGKPQLEVDQSGHTIQPYAVAKVYDMRQYNRALNGWGPFRDDASWDVDWEKLEAIMLVLASNIRRITPSSSSWISKLWAEPFQGTTPRSMKPMKSTRCPHASSSPRRETFSDDKKPKRRLDELDPYGITGTYLRLVCFLDYRVLFNYNWGEMRPRNATAPMAPIRDDEATRLIAMTLAVDRIEWPDRDSQAKAEDESRHADVPTGTTAAASGTVPAESAILEAVEGPLDEGGAPASPASSATSNETLLTDTSSEASSEAATVGRAHDTRSTQRRRAERRAQRRRIRASRMPIVHFSGTSRALHAGWDPNATSLIKGTVRTTPEGEVRWSTVSIFQGDEERWKSEGIQVGGPQSGRGVMGTWFDVNYDAHGPAGPTSFWKVKDEVPDGFFENRGVDDHEYDAEFLHGVPIWSQVDFDDEDDDEDEDEDEEDDEEDEDEEMEDDDVSSEDQAPASWLLDGAVDDTTQPTTNDAADAAASRLESSDPRHNAEADTDASPAPEAANHGTATAATAAAAVGRAINSPNLLENGATDWWN